MRPAIGAPTAKRSLPAAENDDGGISANSGPSHDLNYNVLIRALEEKPANPEP